jgi:hypothetical protein
MLGAFWNWTYSGSPWTLFLVFAFLSWPFAFVAGAIWGSRYEQERHERREMLRRAGRSSPDGPPAD